MTDGSNHDKRPWHDRGSHRWVGMRSLVSVIVVCTVAVLMITTRGQVTIPPPELQDIVKPQIPVADRYQQGRVFLERADKLLKPAANVPYQVLTGNVLFRRGDMYMYCDSAHFYDTENTLQAFGNVKMEQGDTLFVYADELEYTDSTELAVLYADPGKKVRLINRDVELRTDVFNYDMSIELGYYEVGGELTDNTNRLTSLYGEYAPNTKDAIFRNNVHLHSLSKNDTLEIFTEALHYNTDSHVADITAESVILSKDGTIYTDNGVYNTDTEIADLYNRSLVVTQTGRTLTGDTLFYDHHIGYGEAWGNIVLNDTVNKSKLLGNYGFYNELTDSAFVTGNALAVDYSSADSLSLHGDTIQAFRIITVTRKTVPQSTPPVESIAAPDTLLLADIILSDTLVNDMELPLDSLIVDIAVPADSIVVDAPTDSLMAEVVLPDSLTVTGTILDSMPEMIEVADTTHYIVAYPNVRFYRSDLQGVCDSMTFVQRDTLLHMDKDPVVWSDTRQIFGDKIIVHMNDSTADRVILPKNAFMAEMLEEGFYNQMSGRSMVAYLADGTIKHLDVSGNVMFIFYPMEEDSTYNKVANAESSFLSADFHEGDIERLKMWPQSTEVLTPLYMAKRSLFFLKDFRWEGDRRPTGHDDLMPRQQPAEATELLDETTETPAEAADMPDETTEQPDEAISTTQKSEDNE